MSINPKSLINVSLPTKKQTIRAIEIVVVAFVAGSVYSWLHSANPFSKNAVIGAGTAGVAAVYALAKIFLTNL